MGLRTIEMKCRDPRLMSLVFLLSASITLLVTAHSRAMTPEDRRAYREQLLKILPSVLSFDDTRKHGATPILVTSQNLKRLDADGKAVQTLRDFPDAMRQAAKEQNVPLIDLNAMIMQLYEAL